MHASSVAEFLSVTLQTGSGCEGAVTPRRERQMQERSVPFLQRSRGPMSLLVTPQKLTLRDFSGQQLAEPAPRSRSFHRQNGPRETPVRAQDDLFFDFRRLRLITLLRVRCS